MDDITKYAELLSAAIKKQTDIEWAVKDLNDRGQPKVADRVRHICLGLLRVSKANIGCCCCDLCES